MSKSPTDEFFIEARCHWPQLFEFKDFTDPDTGVVKAQSPNISLMFHKVDDLDKINKLKARAVAVCRLRNPQKEESGEFQGQGRLCDPAKMLLQDGDYLNGAEYDGHFKFSATKQQNGQEGASFPFVASPYDPDERITSVDGSHGIYAGCIVTACVSLYFSKTYKRVGAALHAVQFKADGDRLIGGQLSDEAATAGFTRKEKPSIATTANEWDLDGEASAATTTAPTETKAAPAASEWDGDIPF